MTLQRSSFYRGRISLAFTLPEIMIVIAIFSLLLVVLVSSNIFGLRMYRIAETKLSATADGRKALNEIREKIRQSKIVIIGNGNSSGFTNIGDDLLQIGNALQVYPTTNLNVFTRYYLDPEDDNLKRIVSGSTEPSIVSRFVTNRLIFQAEDFRGNILTNDNNNRVVRMTLEFSQWEYPIATVGKGGLYDYYRLQTRVTRRLIE